jgi:hypothetical protein
MTLAALAIGVSLIFYVVRVTWKRQSGMTTADARLR